MKLAILFATLLLAGTVHAATTKNSLGFVYDLPPGWKIVGTKDAFQVIQRPGQTANEVYMVGGLLAAGVANMSDQELMDVDDEFMQSLGPWTRVGAARRLQGANGKLMCETFAGSSDAVGFAGMLFTTINGQKRWGLLAVIDAKLSPAAVREVASDCTAIAKSIQRDPERVPSAGGAIGGRWASVLSGFKLTRSTAADHGSLNGSGGESGEQSYVFYEDGTYAYLRKSMIFISAGDYSSEHESKDEDSSEWTVNTEDGRAFLSLVGNKKGAATYELRRAGDSVLLDGKAFDRVQP